MADRNDSLGRFKEKCEVSKDLLERLELRQAWEDLMLEFFLFFFVWKASPRNVSNTYWATGGGGGLAPPNTEGFKQ